jgi:hypothetical protein
MMHLKKSLFTLALGFGMVVGVSSAHADYLAPVSPIGITGPSLPPLALRHIATHTDHCRYIVVGDMFTPHGQIKFIVHNTTTGVEVSSYLTADAVGSFNTFIYLEPNDPPMHVKVYAVDVTTKLGSNVVGENVSCAS